MSLHDFLTAIGVDPGFLVAGGAGGTLRALSRRRLKFREVVLSPICGVLAAAYLTIPAVEYVHMIGVPMPSSSGQGLLAAAFLIGTSAMWIADALFALIARRFGQSLPS